MLEIKWDKKKDKLNIKTPPLIQKIRKEDILQKISSIYDVLGFISPCTLVGKDFLVNFVHKYTLRQKSTTRNYKNMVKVGKSFSYYVEISRSITNVQEKIKEIELHLFGDASIIGTSSVAYAIIQQNS